MSAELAPISAEARAAVEGLLDIDASSATATIHERMVAILAELPEIGKGSYNKQQGFHYRSHDDVLNALNPLLAKHGVFVVPNVLERIANADRVTKSGNTMYEVNLHVRFTFYGLAGDSITASAWGEGTDSGDKSTNKAMTAAFKYCLAQSFAVSTGDTLDSDSDSPEPTSHRRDVGDGQTRPRGRQSRKEREQERAPAPDTFWKDWKEQLAGQGVHPDDQDAWFREPLEMVPNDERRTRASDALERLVEAGGIEFRQDARMVMQNVIAAAFNGLAVTGPPWRIGLARFVAQRASNLGLALVRLSQMSLLHGPRPQ